MTDETLNKMMTKEVERAAELVGDALTAALVLCAREHIDLGVFAAVVRGFGQASVQDIIAQEKKQGTLTDIFVQNMDNVTQTVARTLLSQLSTTHDSTIH